VSGHGARCPVERGIGGDGDRREIEEDTARDCDSAPGTIDSRVAADGGIVEGRHDMAAAAREQPDARTEAGSLRGAHNVARDRGVGDVEGVGCSRVSAQVYGRPPLYDVVSDRGIRDVDATTLEIDHRVRAGVLRDGAADDVRVTMRVLDRQFVDGGTPIIAGENVAGEGGRGVEVLLDGDTITAVVPGEGTALYLESCTVA